MLVKELEDGERAWSLIAALFMVTLHEKSPAGCVMVFPEAPPSASTYAQL